MPCTFGVFIDRVCRSVCGGFFLPLSRLGRRTASESCGEDVFADDFAGERCLPPDEASPDRDWSSSVPGRDGIEVSPFVVRGGLLWLERVVCSGGAVCAVPWTCDGLMLSGGSNCMTWFGPNVRFGNAFWMRSSMGVDPLRFDLVTIPLESAGVGTFVGGLSVRT